MHKTDCDTCDVASKCDKKEHYKKVEAIYKSQGLNGLVTWCMSMLKQSGITDKQAYIYVSTAVEVVDTMNLEELSKLNKSMRLAAQESKVVEKLLDSALYEVAGSVILSIHAQAEKLSRNVFAALAPDLPVSSPAGKMH